MSTCMSMTHFLVRAFEMERVVCFLQHYELELSGLHITYLLVCIVHSQPRSTFLDLSIL